MEVAGVEGGRSTPGSGGVVLTKSTRANSIHQRASSQQAVVIWTGSAPPSMSIHNHGPPSLSLEIDLLFKVTRVSQCVFTTIRFRP